MTSRLRLNLSIRPPEANETHPVMMSDGATILLRRYGNPGGPRVALSHGNGMAIQAYFPFWQQMLTDYDLILFDSRNHGRNPVNGVENHNWAQFQDDFEAVRQAIDKLFGAHPTAAVFHSLASVTALMQTRKYGERWAPLVLIDPPVFPPPGHHLEPLQLTHMREMDAIARRRPDRFDDPEDLAAILRTRRAFSRWPKGIHDLYALETLRHTGAGWELVCPKELEARTFATNIDPTIWPIVGDLPGTVAVVGADTNLPEAGPPAFLGQSLAAENGLPFVMIADTTHFLQIECPQVSWQAVEDIFRSAGAIA